VRVPLRTLPLTARLTRAGACLLLAGGCTALRPVGPEELSGPSRPDSARVMLADHSTVVLYGPRVVGDTLVGTTMNGVRRHVLLSQTTAIQVRESAPDRTVGLVFGIVAAVGAIVVFETMKGGCTPKFVPGTVDVARCGDQVVTP
jgi:hypothetical protein